MAGQVGLADPDQQDPRRSVIPTRQTEKKRIRRRRCCRLRNRLHRGCPTMRTQECENKCMFQDVDKQMYEHIWGDQLGVPTNLLSLFQLPLAAKLVTTKPKNMITVV